MGKTKSKAKRVPSRQDLPPEGSDPAAGTAGKRQVLSEALVALLEKGDWRKLPPEMARDVHGPEMGGAIYRSAMSPHLVINGPDGQHNEKLDKASPRATSWTCWSGRRRRPTRWSKCS